MRAGVAVFAKILRTHVVHLLVEDDGFITQYGHYYIYPYDEIYFPKLYSLRLSGLSPEDLTIPDPRPGETRHIYF